MNVLNDNNDDSAIDKIEHQLYDPKVKVNDTEIHQLHKRRNIDLPTSWGEESNVIIKGKEEKGTSFGVKLLFFATILLILSLSFSMWRVFSLRNVVSSTNIDMSLDVASYVEGGEQTPLMFTLRNRNTSSLENAKITLLYIQGSGAQDEQEKVQEKRDLGNVLSNEYKKQDFNVVLYGSEGETRDLTIKLEYQVVGSNAVFTKIVNTKSILRAPPVSVSVSGPDKVSVGQSVSYSFSVTNNSATTTIPSILEIIAPNSFIIESTSEKSIARKNSWIIGKLAKGESKTITLNGTFEGKQDEKASFSAKVGSFVEDSLSMGIVFSSFVFDTTLRQSPLTVSATLSSDGSDDSIRYGDKATIMIQYSNTSLTALEDVKINLSLSGDAPVYSNVDPTNGYYDSLKKTITWDKSSVVDLGVLPPNYQGYLRVIVPIVQKGINSPFLKIVVTGTASTKSSEDVVNIFTKSWGVKGSASLTAHTQYKNSPFVNTGPVPPAPNKETSYTAHLKVIAENTLKEARVSFTLPVYVTWKGEVSGQGVTYDSRTRTVSWNIARLTEGSSTESFITLIVKPSQSHINKTPSITSGVVFDAEEEISRARTKITLSPLTISLYNEAWPKNPSFVSEE